MIRLAAASAIIVLYILFCLYVATRYRNRHQSFKAHLEVLSGGNGTPVLIAFASQTGVAEQLAFQTAESLQSVGIPVRVSSLATLDPATLSNTPKALFVVSTTGEGDAPDSTVHFARKIMNNPKQLSGLQYGLLALGDRSYKNFCGFGRMLDSWLQHQGAEALFDRVEVDDNDEGALRHWQHHLSLISGGTALVDWSTPVYGRWKLIERRLLNTNSPGGPAFHLILQCMDESPMWQAGDIAEMGPCNAASQVAIVLNTLGLHGTELVQDAEAGTTLGQLLSRSVLPCETELQDLQGSMPQALVAQLKPLPHREYSIASLPADGQLELLVRQMCRPDGRLGIGSGWLTAHASPGAEIALRVRSNRSFHAPENDRPMILIGNGTGVAGLRAHLMERAAAGRSRNWLLFGERTAAHDYFYRNEIESWQAAGVLTRVDLAFSRDQNNRVYVQHRLAAARNELIEWVEQGAAIYVCGSLAGMSSAVTAVLKDCLGDETLEDLTEQGRYRRDVY